MGLIDALQLERTACTAPSGRPACPKCRARPTVQNAVQIRSGFEYLTLRCTSYGLVYDAQVHPFEVRCSGLDGQRASATKVRPYRLLVREYYLSFHRQSHKARSRRSLGYRAPLRRIDR